MTEHARDATAADELVELIEAALRPVREWQQSFGTVARHPSQALDDAGLLGATLAELGVRLRDNYPFHHPRYAGQMLKPPHPVAIAAYTATMLINPNNHALDGGPATAALEKEVVAELATMFGFDTHLGHLASSGTTGNLEALFVARESHPGRGIAYSAEAHYTHARMCHVLGVEGVGVPVDATGRMDVDALAEVLRGGRVGTVVATLGTTGLGAVDPVDTIVAVAREHGVRIHVDAAYGGFFTLVADNTDEGVASAPFAAVRLADSVVVDPHKHGLQPYGCGAVLFADPSVGRFYAHDSPYTYFTSDELHLGEISLECSRAGAAAAALWATLRVLPSRPRGSAQWCGRGCGPPDAGRSCWTPPTCSTSTSRRSWTSCPTSRACPRSARWTGRAWGSWSAPWPTPTRCSSPRSASPQKLWDAAGRRWRPTSRRDASCAASS